MIIMVDTINNLIKIIQKSYLKGIEDILTQILTENYTIEKIHELHSKIKESKALSFEDKIINLASE